MSAPEPTPWGCTRHAPVQHRDRRPPWCDLCGRTADGTAPALPEADPAIPLPPPGTRVRSRRGGGRAGVVADPADHPGLVPGPGQVLVRYPTGRGSTTEATDVRFLIVLPAID